MKKLTCLAMAAVAFNASPVAAQSSDFTFFDITATVPESCTIGEIDNIVLGELSINIAEGEDALLWEQETLQQSAPNIFVSCNVPNTITFTSALGNLVNLTQSVATGDDAALFTDQIDYEIAFIGNNGAPGFDTFDPDGTADFVVAQNFGAIQREITPQVTARRSDNGLRPLAGQYSDTVTIVIQAI